MINAVFKKYDVFKDSGIEWLGDVPSHWEIRRLKDIGISIIGITYSPDDVVEDESEGILVLRASNIQGNKLSLLDNVFVNKKVSVKQIVRKGDILLCSRSGSRSLIGKNICVDDQIAGTTFGAFMTIYRSRYFKFISGFFNSKFFEAQSGLFMTSTINQLTISTLNNLLVALPPLDEQKAIAAYLDERTAQIDHKIDLLTQKAAQYAQLKQALINETVTRGLDKTALLKESGIEWLGPIPTHWEVKRHKDHFIFINKKCNDMELAKVGLENIESKTGKFIFTDSDFDGIGIEFRENDILFGKLRPYLAKVYLAEFNGSAVGDIFVYRPKSDIVPKFARYLMLSDRYIDVINSSTVGAKMPRVSSGFIANLPVAIPTLYEQKAIANYLDTKTAHIDRIVETINHQIETLRECRKTLINDVVTGKIKIIDNGEWRIDNE